MPLIREVNKDIRETGENDLFIGYPFVIGKTNAEDFNVHAPLALFPVAFKCEPNRITLQIDRSKDVLLNNNLILLYNKINNKSNDLPNNVLEEVKESTFINSLLDYYKQNGIHISEELPTISKFDEYTMDTFPKFEEGEYRLCNNAILGKFSLCSSSLQKDFKNIIENGEINDLLNNLLAGMNDIDIFSDTPVEKITQPTVFAENELDYINDLNFSQENAILSIERGNELVIQGPPGTGKSQTITSLITDAVVSGKNVLMVSQKKAALDVIYSRLGNLSKYAVLISDVKDKSGFYQQVLRLFNNPISPTYNNHEISVISHNIDSNIGKLDILSEKLYQDTVLGVPMYRIYQENQDNLFHTKQIINPDMYFNNVKRELTNISYTRLIEIYDNFKNTYNTNMALQHLEICLNHTWLKDIKPNLDNFARNEMCQELENFFITEKDFLQLKNLKKFIGSFKRKHTLNKIYKKFFANRKSYKNIYKNVNQIPLGLEVYDRYLKTESYFAPLKQDERNYLHSLYMLKNTTTEDIQTLNKNLFDFIVSCYIDNFETQNRTILADIANFDCTVKNVCDIMSQKKDLTKQKAGSVLSGFYDNFVRNSKRGGEIQRAIESKRRSNIASIIKRFSFELFKGIKIWLLTPEVVSEILPLEHNLFDLLIFDEASQLYVERAIPAIYRTRKVVIAGDHKQLRPSSLGFGRIEQIQNETDDYDDENINAALEEESLLDLARFKYPQVMLNYHYRSKYAELINFSNYAFYNGQLNVSPNLVTPKTPPIEVVKINNGLWHNRTNKPEAKKTIEIIKNYLTSRKNNETLGVVTFNSSQRDLIMDLLDEACIKDPDFSEICKKEFNRKDDGEDVGLFIKNIENVQGDERDCIIFSITYGKNEDGKIIHNFGWLNQLGGENRLNVAISRAKQKIYIVTSIEPEDLDVDSLQNNGPKMFKKYLAYANAISKNKTDLAQSILLSCSNSQTYSDESNTNEFEKQVSEHLMKLGCSIDYNVGIGEYKVDIAIKSKTSNKYVLGIECDGKLYSKNKTARERDIHRQKYLESRGWNIYRLWSTNWWHDKEKVLKKINILIKSIDC